MKKMLAIMIMLILATSLLASCGKKDIETTPGFSDKPETSDSSNKPKDPDTSEDDPPIEMGELALVFGDVDISLPITKVEELIAHGWEPFNEASAARLEKTLNPKERSFLTLIKGDSYYIIMDIANLSDDVITASQGTIICLNDIMEENMLELPSDIVQGVSTRGELIAAYGEPDRDVPEAMYMSYDMEGFRIAFTVGPEENDVLGMIDIDFKDYDDFRFTALD